MARSRTKRRWYRRPAVMLLSVPGLFLAGLVTLVGAYLFATVPLPDDILASATRVLDRHGEEVGTLSPQAARQDVDLADLPDHVPQAVLAAEDRAFFEHGGISYRGTARALLRNIIARDIAEGGSTITQQYIKNAALSPEQTFRRKAQEAILAVKLEQQYEKEEILSFYLNTIYWGRGAYGVEAAAQTYFGVSATELDTNQAATLAGIIRSPERLDPADTPATADIRRRYTLEGMGSEGWLDPAEMRSLVDAGLPEVTGRANVEFGPYAYYLDAVRRQLAAELGDEVVFRGLTVTTELDTAMQRTAQEVVAERLADLPEHLDDLPVSGALVTVDPEDGAVRAVVGGPDFATQQFNAAIRGASQSGSAFKPFGLAAFLDAGFHPDSRFDAPGTLRDVAFPDGSVYPEVSNFGGRSFGEQTVRQATWTSTNTVYVQMAAEVGSDQVKDLAVRAGIRDDDDVQAVPSLVLGTADVSVLEMANAYATFASGGVRNTPRLVRSVDNAQGDLIFEAEPEHEATMPSNVAYGVSDLLQGVIQGGTGTRANIGRPAAGKTGTTQESRDAWFVGYVPQLATAVWIGTLDDTPMGDVTGGSIPAEIWAAFMSEATAEMEPLGFPAPDYSDLDQLREAEPSPSPSPSPFPTQCPDEDGELVDVVLEPGQDCPTPSPVPSPTPDEQPPTPTPSPTGTTAPDPPDDDDDDEGDDEGDGGGGDDGGDGDDDGAGD